MDVTASGRPPPSHTPYGGTGDRGRQVSWLAGLCVAPAFPRRWHSGVVGRARRLQLRGQPRIWPPHRVDRTAFPFHPKAAWPREPFAGAERGRPARILSTTIFPVDRKPAPAACFHLRWFFRRASVRRKRRGKPGAVDPKRRPPAGAAPATVSGERSPPLPLEPRFREGKESAPARSKQGPDPQAGRPATQRRSDR